MNQYVGSLVLVVISSAVTGGLVTHYNSKRADEAIQKAALLETQVEALVKAGEQISSEAKSLKAQADVQTEAAKQDGVTILRLQSALAVLKAARPGGAGAPQTPVENAQDELITALEAKNRHLEDANTGLSAAFDKMTASRDAFRDGLAKEQERSKQLETALRKIPKERPWSIGLIYGRNDTGVTQYGVHGSRAFGPVHVGAVIMPHFAGVEAGFNF